MHKWFQTVTTLAVIAVLVSCAPAPAPTSAPSLPASFTLTPTTRPSVTPYPTPTRAPTWTPADQSTALPSLTPFPNVPGTKVDNGTPMPQGTPLGNDTSYGCLDATLVKDVTIPDGTKVDPGASFVKTWRFFNSGSCQWLGSTVLKFIKGERMLPSYDLINHVVAVGDKADVSITMTAPTSAGSYKTYFRLSDKGGNAFGPMVFVSIVVASTISTLPVPTSTKAPTAAATP